MKRFFSFFLVAAFLGAVSWSSLAYALTLEEVLAFAPTYTPVLTAQLELEDAQNDLRRKQNDPLGLRLDRVQAEQRLAAAEADLRAALYTTMSELTETYMRVLETRTQRDLAEKTVALRERLLEAVRIRLETGSATELDVQEATNALEEAEEALRAARERLSLSQSALETIIGSEVDPASLEPVPDSYFVPVPPFEGVLGATESHPDTLQARQARALAELNVEMLNPIFTSPADIERARTQLETAQETETKVLRDFRLDARDLYIQAEAARETYRVEQEALQNARERLSFQQSRRDAGLLSQVEYEQAELDALSAEVEALNARNAYLRALLALQLGTSVDLGLPGLEEVRSEL